MERFFVVVFPLLSMHGAQRYPFNVTQRLLFFKERKVSGPQVVCMEMEK